MKVMIWPVNLVFPMIAFLVSMFGTWILIKYLSDKGAIDVPNPRSNHLEAKPLGGGIAIVIGLYPVWIAISYFQGSVNIEIIALAGLGMVLSGVSWLDDLRGLGALLRIIVHTLVVFVALWAAPFSAPLFGGFFPPVIDTVLIGIIWIWFINLFNFMDGIDGLAGVEMLALGVGLFVVANKLQLGEAQMLMSLTIAATGLGFLRWNWYPAKIFMGDVGSIPVGFAIGWLLIETAARGAWAAAIILPLYFLADATLTLAHRFLKREPFWIAHKQHFYQRAVETGLRHDQVVWIIAVANLFLIMLAVVSTRGLSGAAIIGAIAAILLLLFLLVKGGPTE